MKFWVGIIFGVAVGFGGAGLVFTQGQQHVAADCPGLFGEPCWNGDVNADGNLNIADPIYLLAYLFGEGPSPVGYPAGAAQLPATGQTISSVVGDDGHHRTGCPMQGRLIDNRDGTVTDTCTGLMWQQATADKNEDGQISSADEMRFREAINYCENLDFARHTDWRLPNVRELQSIVDYGQFNPGVDPIFEAQATSYWSSSYDAGWGEPEVFVWQVSLLGGSAFTSMADANCVRAVRTAQ